MKIILKKISRILVLFLIVCVLGIPLDSLAASTVKINKTSSTLYVGNTVNLKIYGTKTKIKWSTTNKKVATVSNGKVTAKKAGTTTINAKVGKDTYTCDVTVQNPSLNYTQISLNIGNSYNLKLNGTKAKSWSTSNKKIATINSKGKIVAKNLGSATISVKGANGKTYKCKVTVQEVHNHSYNSSITRQPTCTESGILTYTCACGDSYTETLSPTGHKSSDWIIDSNPTCTTNGSKQTICTVCGIILNTETIPATGHTWNSGVITKTPTCLEEGIKTYTCTTCGTTRTETIAKTEHIWGNGVIAKTPTCTEDGIKTYTCTICGTTRNETIPAIGHTWDSGVITKSPTCLEEGIKTYTCSISGTTRTETIAKIPHNFVMGAIIPPTCTEDGYTNYTCSVCGTTEQRDIIPALGHTYVDVVVAPTCTESGYTTHTCSRDGNTYTDTYIDAKGHTYGNFVETVAPVDFNTFGTADMVCPDCGEILYTDLTVVLIDLGNGNTTKVYGFYDRAEADTCFNLTYQYKVANNCISKYGFTWDENAYSYACIRAAENAYEYNIKDDISHVKPSGTALSYGENIAYCTQFDAGDSTFVVEYNSNMVFQDWLKSTDHRENIEAIYHRTMSSAKFTAWIPDWNGWGIFWNQVF